MLSEKKIHMAQTQIDFLGILKAIIMQAHISLKSCLTSLMIICLQNKFNNS